MIRKSKEIVQLTGAIPSLSLHTDHFVEQFILIRMKEQKMKKLKGTILKTIIFFMGWILLIIPNLQFNNDAYQ
ncbi:hypothetical protein SPD89_01740, partial [Pseudogracilibacillus sp. SO30301A]